MLKVSEAFRTAIRNSAPQRALLRFSNATFGNSDISITGGGIRLTEIINGDTNLHYGLCSSARLEASIINHNNLLEKFEFGEFQASLGVLTKTEKLPYDSWSFVVTKQGNVFTVGADGQLYANGRLANLQTGWPLRLLVLENDDFYAFGDAGTTLFGRIASDGVTINQLENPVRINAVMWNKIERLMKSKVGYRIENDVLVEYSKGRADTYEFAPLGTFIAPKPSVLRKVVIELEAEDRMQLFDSDLSDVNFTYPLTMTQAYNALCQSVGVESVTQNIPNGDLSLTKKPDLFDGATKRDVLGWIAEASATYARFNREGKLELTRFNETGMEYDEHDYVSASPSAYSVKPYGKLHIRNADSNIEQVVGEGDNAYLIQDNPFLKPKAMSAQTRSTSATASTTPADEILSALGELGTFAPVAADTFADWTMQAGDVVTIKSGDDAYKTPLYTMNMTWKGSSRVTMESTGDEKPQPIPVFERRRYAGGRSAARAKEENEEFKTWAEFHIDEAEANIKLLTGSVTTATGEYINVEVELNGLKGVVSQKAEASVVTEQGNLITAAQQEINGLKATIVQKADASVVTDQGEQITSAWQEINGLKGEISDKASKSEVTAEGQRVLTEAGQLITASEGRIMQYVTVYDEQGKPLSSVQLALDAKADSATLTAKYVTIDALNTTVSGLVKTEDLETETLKVLESARIPDLKALAFSCSGRATVNEIWATGGVITNATIPNLICNTSAEFSGDLTIKGTAFNPADYATQDWVKEQGYLKGIPSGYATESWVLKQKYVTASEITTGVTTKSLYIPTDGKITIPTGAELSLFGYKPRWNQMSFVTGVTIETEQANVMLSDGTSKRITYITGYSTPKDTITYLYRGS